MKQTDVTKWSGILVYLECCRGQIHSAGLELIGEAERLAAVSGEDIYVLAIGACMEEIKKHLEGCPIKEAHLYETEDEYDPDLYEAASVDCIQKIHPSIVLIGGTYEGRALAPRLAVEFGTGLTADCTSLSMDETGGLVQTRPAFGGNVMASIVTQFCRPQFATVRPGVMASIERNTEAKNSTDITYIMGTIPAIKSRIHIIESEEAESASDITSQEILVVAGRGVKKKEDLKMLEELADLLGGKLASSRALVEKGWMSPKQQIGLSGNSVSPKYMITCGVSGTVQFMAGMKHTKNIIAINTDPNARIFEIAHYPVCGDIYEIVPELIKKLREGKENRNS